MNSNLDPAAFSVAYTAHEETDCGTDCGTECGPKGCVCLEACVQAYISHIAASPADLRSVLAYDAGLAEGRRQGVEEAANSLDMSNQTIRLHAGELSASEMRAVKAVLAWNATAIRALIKEADGE